ncbi:MAG: hypothetical protein ABIF40_02765 [archaeon]
MKRFLIVLIISIFLIGCGPGVTEDYEEAQENLPEELQDMIQYQDPENIPEDFPYIYIIYPNGIVESFVKIDSAELPAGAPQGTIPTFISYIIQEDTTEDVDSIKQYYDDTFIGKGWQIQNNWIQQGFSSNSYNNNVGWQEPGFVTVSINIADGKYENDISISIMEY